LFVGAHTFLLHIQPSAYSTSIILKPVAVFVCTVSIISSAACIIYYIYQEEEEEAEKMAMVNVVNMVRSLFIVHCSLFEFRMLMCFFRFLVLRTDTYFLAACLALPL
jgi:hypothetical protein